MDKWINVEDKSIPRQGNEFLTRNDNQGGTFLLIRWNNLHKHFLNKADYISESNAGTHWMQIPK